MKKKENIFPPSFLSCSAEEHFHYVARGGHHLYLVILFLLVGVIAALPLLRVEITFATRGILRSGQGNHPVIPAVAARVVSCNIQENRRVSLNDTLVVLQHEEITAQLEYIRQREKKIAVYLEDLHRLLAGEKWVCSPRYKQEQAEYEYFLQQAETELKYSSEQFNITRELYHSEVVPRLEYEEVKNRHHSLTQQMALRREQYLHRWHTALAEYEEERHTLHTRSRQLEDKIKQYYILAPSEGTLVHCAPLLPGVQVIPHRAIAQIVPRRDLVADCILMPDKIAMIRPGLQVRYRLDAYPSSISRRLEGTVSEIPEDATLESGLPVYRVTCSIPQFIQFEKSGKQESLRSGMTFTAHFVLNKKSVWQLIIEKTERWFYPVQNRTTS